MVRATTGGVLKTYRYNLMRSFITANKARDTVTTQRNFNSYAEDPASAAKAFRLRMSRLTTQSQYDICQNTYFKFQSGFQSLQTVDQLIDTENGGTQLQTLKSTTLKMLNDPTGDARTQLSKVLDVMSETLVQMMNQKYGDDFIFAGADGHNVPFEVKQADGRNQLFYRGIPVDAAVPEVFGNASGPIEVDENGKIGGTGGYYLKTENTSIISKDTYDNDTAAFPNILRGAGGTPQEVGADGTPGTGYYIVINGDPKEQVISKEDYATAEKNVEKLEYLANEKRFIDIGLGFQENENGQLIESSAFNESLNGLTFLGYGLDEEGDPKNIYSIVQRLSEIAGSVSDDEDWSQETYDEFYRLVGKLEDASSEFKTQFANMDAGTLKLKNNLDLLKENFYNLDEQTANLEDAEPVEAIENFLWAEYAYNAALKVGNSILSQSLMDYLT